MTISVEALLIMALMMAVFAAVSTVGSSLYLGAGYERLRSGFENIKKQTAFFSNAIHTLDQRVDSVEKQSTYFFETISALEQKSDTPPQLNDSAALQQTSTQDARPVSASNLLEGEGFMTPSPDKEHRPAQEFEAEKAQPITEIRFH